VVAGSDAATMKTLFGDETTELHMVGFADKLVRCATFGLRHFVPLPSSLRSSGLFNTAGLLLGFELLVCGFIALSLSVDLKVRNG
jgi:hypothetical protein